MGKLFKDKRITIMGLGLHGGGVGVAKFFCEQGAKVLVTDLKTEEQLAESVKKLKKFKIEYVLGSHRQKDFIETDLVIKNPAVPNSSPYIKIAENNNIPVRSDIDIFFDLCEAPIIGITGTKGKSTVATLAYLFLKSKYPKTVLAGNIGISPLEVLSEITKASKVVLELSSFELEGLKKSPNLAIITSIMPDHLNRYKNFKEYIEAKKLIFKYQKENDILILNYDDSEMRRFAEEPNSKVYFFSQKNIPHEKIQESFACFMKDGSIFFDGEEKGICEKEDIKLTGGHNISNILAAASVARIMKVPLENIKKILKKFKGVPFRQEFIKEINGVKYFNDTTATMPDAVIMAIRNFFERFPKSNIILIAGGEDKNLNYKKMAIEVCERLNQIVLLPGSATDKLKKELVKIKKSKKLEIINAKNLKEAVRRAAFLAKAGDIVLLSPGAASFTPLEVTTIKEKHKALKPLTGFNLFKNEFDRGRQFNQIIKGLSRYAGSRIAGKLNDEPKPNI